MMMRHRGLVGDSVKKKKGINMKKKKQNIFKLFFISLLKSILCIIIVLGVGFASYKISYTILSNGEGVVDTDTDSLKDILDDVTIDEVSRNLIYVSDDKNKLTRVMLEICNTKTNNMDYVTIPVKTNYTIPSVMYRKLCQVNQEIPQVIRVSELKHYFEDESDAYGYGVLIFEKMLGIDISYYTAISQEIYNNHYTQKSVRVGYKTQSSLNNTPEPDGTIPSSNTTLKVKMKISVLSDAYQRQLNDLNHDQTKIADFIKEQYERVSSNLTTYNKIGYVEAYEKMDSANFHYWGIPGTYTEDKVFEIDTKAAKKALKQLMENTETYTAPQDLSKLNMMSGSSNGASEAPKDDGKKQLASSKGLQIYVLNGSQIAGLASLTKTKS